MMTVDSDLDGPSPQFTLTCISTGGPATTVTWTRDSVTVTEGTETVFDDPVTAQYTHTLTVTGTLGGLYTCTVANNKPSSDAAVLMVYVQGIVISTMNSFLSLLSLIAPSPPSGVSASQNGLGSLLVSWTSGDPAVTGYIIYYQQQDGGQRLSTTAEANEANITITGLVTGVTYSISVAATSGALPSTETVAPHDVTIGIPLSDYTAW